MKTPVAIAGLVAVIAVIAFFVMRPGPSTSPPLADPDDRYGKPIAAPDAAAGSIESQVVSAQWPEGQFVTAKLTSDVDAVEAEYAKRLATVRLALPGVGLEAREEPMVLLRGRWEKDAAAWIVIPVSGSADARTLEKAGLSLISLEGGDAMGLDATSSVLSRGLVKVAVALNEVARQDESPTGGPILYQLSQAAEGHRIHATLNIMEQQP
ncbi:MAG: hypothetical protein KDA24_20590 [Deltaproteobacteria bacterium]|nr:hypothetical protein [Deltaproteobacteria bacterium]